jgi:DNA-binding NarL/FixJ family response regulator
MPKVLIVSATDLAPELGRSLLWRDDIERVFVPPLGEAAFQAARRLEPRLVVVDGADSAATLELIRRLRADDATRTCSIAVLSRSPGLADEEGLRTAGANLILAGEAEPSLWDSRFEELLDVPRRLEMRIKVRFEVWSRFEPDTEPIEAIALNISLRGLLLETEEPLDIGTNLDLHFTLPGQEDELRAVGKVVREAQPSHEGRHRSGVELMILRGDTRQRLLAFTEAEVRK